MRELLLTLVLASASCCTLPPDQAALFFSKHPEMRQRFESLEPASIEALWLGNVQLSGQDRSTSRLLNEHLTEEQKDGPFSLYLKNVKAETDERETELENLKAALVEGDYLYLYTYEFDGHHEYGLLVINGGEIRMKDPWISGLFTETANNRLASPEYSAPQP